jgi:non-ribosomal peptide synthetase component E (peptide arylation enzyme)
MLGYLNDPDKTMECLSDTKWLRTGDVAMYDEDGYFYITDRIKELIKGKSSKKASQRIPHNNVLVLVSSQYVDSRWHRLNWKNSS